MRERELKLRHPGVVGGEDESLPMRERELKQRVIMVPGEGLESLPMRERELKPQDRRPGLPRHQVAPHAGA